MAKVGVVAVGAEAVVAFLPHRTWGFFQVLEIPRAGSFFLRAGVAPGVVGCRGWGCPKALLGAAAGRRPGLMWLPDRASPWRQFRWWTFRGWCWRPGGFWNRNSSGQELEGLCLSSSLLPGFLQLTLQVFHPLLLLVCSLLVFFCP